MKFNRRILTTVAALCLAGVSVAASADTLDTIKQRKKVLIAVDIGAPPYGFLDTAAKQAGLGSGLFAGAGAFAFHALWMIIIAIALAIAWLLDSLTVIGPWGAGTIAFITTAVFSLLVAFILAKLGQSRFRKVSKPEATIAEAKATLSAISDAVSGHNPLDRELAARDTISGSTAIPR